MDQGNTAFVLLAAALVLLMTPGLAFFYGGLVKAKSVVSMMMLSFGSLALISVLWIMYGYAVAFANAGTPGFVGIDGWFGIDTDLLGLSSLLQVPEGAAFPPLAFAACPVVQGRVARCRSILPGHARGLARAPALCARSQGEREKDLGPAQSDG